MCVLLQVISALRDKQREIRTAFQAKWDEFKKLDKAWKGWFAEERKKRCVGSRGAGEGCWQPLCRQPHTWASDVCVSVSGLTAQGGRASAAAALGC